MLDYLTLHTRSDIMYGMENIDRKPLGVIEALSAGFELVLRHPYMLLVPLALDLFLWLGPQIHAKPVFDEAVRLLAGAAPAPGSSPDAQQALDAFKSAVQATGESFNLISIVALFALGIPTLVVVDPPADIAAPNVLFSVSDPVAFFGWVVLFGFIGLFLGSVYLQVIAHSVRRDAGWGAFAARVVKSFTHVLTLFLLVVVGSAIVVVPFFVSAAMVSVLSPGLGFFLILACWLVLMWAALYMAFAIPAIFVSGANVPQAIMNSIAVFRYNFWSAIGLIFLVILIQMGFSVVWDALLGSTMGMLVGMVANAVLGTAMAAAMMLFYADRFTWLQQVRDRIRQQQRPSLKG